MNNHKNIDLKYICSASRKYHVPITPLGQVHHHIQGCVSPETST